MPPPPHPFTASPSCWRCDTAVPVRRLVAEGVLRVRAAEEGGPYEVWTCGCGADCGVLTNGAGDRLLHPLEGLDEPGLLERLVPRQSRDAQRAAVLWWQRHRAHVERFRRAAERRQTAAPPPPPRARSRKRADHSTEPPRESPPHGRRSAPRPPPPPPRPQTPPEPRRPRDFDERTPRELLGVPDDADADAIRSAYRAALKLCHPDRVANLDPEIQDVAHRKSKALRRAYEQLLRDAGD